MKSPERLLSVDRLSSEEEILHERNFNGELVGRNMSARMPCTITSPKDLSCNAFKVYDKVLEKHRYIPRKWTQEEFEAALPERFLGKTTVNASKGLATKKDNFSSDDEHLLTCRGKAIQHLNPRGKVETSQKIRKLRQIFETAAKVDGDSERSNSPELQENFQTKYEREKDENVRREMDELERGKDSEARVKCLEDDLWREKQETSDVEEDFFESEAKQSGGKSFLTACFRCLLNIEAFIEMLSELNLPQDNPSPLLVKLQSLLSSFSSIGKNRQPSFEDVDDLVSYFYANVSSVYENCEELLANILDVLTQEFQHVPRDKERDLLSIFEGKLCHEKTCEFCKSTEKEFESFLYLNPTTASGDSLQNIGIVLNFLFSDTKQSVWHITSRYVQISRGTTVLGLKEEILKYSEFSSSHCDLHSLRIAEVKGKRVTKIFSNEEDISTQQLSFDSCLFAYYVLNFHSDVPKTISTTNSNPLSHHLYFSCGLCLCDDKNGLFVHRTCGGMICRDCLKVIMQSHEEWEPCPCPVCDRPIDLDKELRKAGTSAVEWEKSPPAEENFECQFIFRAKDLDGRVELFGCPLIASLPQQITGHHLYRGISYLLPSALPMKDRTSFTLHTVDESGLHCSTCSRVTCSGCLIRIDNDIKVTFDTNLVVHFDGLAVESKKHFGTVDSRLPQNSAAQNFFGEILKSCVNADASQKTSCLNCFHTCISSSSIATFPHLLVVHLDAPCTSSLTNMCIADVNEFCVVHHGNNSKTTTRNHTYQLTAAVIADEDCEFPRYKALVAGFTNDRQLIFEESHVSEIQPTQVHLTSCKVLFFRLTETQPHLQTTMRVLTMPSIEDRFGKDRQKIDEKRNAAFHDYGGKLGRISEDTATINCPNYISRPSTTAENKMNSKKRRKRPHDRHESDEYRLVTGNSQLSLGEISQDYLAESMAADFEEISPISAMRDTWKSDGRVARETKKLITAIKREDAYGIVCSLKRGGNPCLLINDLTALHLAAGMKSNQRHSMMAYLLKYSNDVNVPTGDGTTPVHVAAAWGHQDVLELLLAHGGDAFDITDQEGNSAFDLASKNCSSFLHAWCQCSETSPGHSQPLTSSRTSQPGQTKEPRLEDIVRTNLTLPSFVADTNQSTGRRLWLRRFQSFRKKSSGVFKSLRKISSKRRRSRIGVMRNEMEDKTVPTTKQFQ